MQKKHHQSTSINLCLETIIEPKTTLENITSPKRHGFCYSYQLKKNNKPTCVYAQFMW